MASTSKILDSNTEDITSIHAGLIEEVHDVPMAVLIRPFPLEVDEDKVLSIMKTLQVRSVVFHCFTCWQFYQNLFGFACLFSG
jgi:hypothetical protein